MSNGDQKPEPRLHVPARLPPLRGLGQSRDQVGFRPKAERWTAMTSPRVDLTESSGRVMSGCRDWSDR